MDPHKLAALEVSCVDQLLYWKENKSKLVIYLFIHLQVMFQIDSPTALSHSFKQKNERNRMAYTKFYYDSFVTGLCRFILKWL